MKYHGAAFFNQPAPVLAQALLGQELLHILPDGRYRSGRIVETEAYLFENDPASHYTRKETKATHALRMGPGTLYVHAMRAWVGVDIVARQGSVLIRALEPLKGLPQHLCQTNGPGKLSQAMGITKSHDGLNLTSVKSTIRLLKGAPVPVQSVEVTPRIGLARNTGAPLRFAVSQSKFLSRKS